MTTLQQTSPGIQLDAIHTAKPATPGAIDFARKLREQTIACRVGHKKMGTRRALTADQAVQAAAPFGADSKFLDAKKKLLDTRHPKFMAVTKCRRAANDYWEAHTVPYPETQIRLLRKDQLDDFVNAMRGFRTQLKDAVTVLQTEYDDLKHEAEERLGTLFNEGDYPIDVRHEFDMEWDFPSIDPPAYLKKAAPHLYEQESAKINARFSEACAMAEQGFIEQFQKLVGHMVDRLGGEVDGKPKIFHGTSVTNLQEFFEQFKALNVGTSEELDKLVEQAQSIVGGLKPDELRDSDSLRKEVGAKLATVAETLDGLMVAKPKRKITLEENPESS